MDSNLFTSLGRGSCTQFAKQAEACFTYTTYIKKKLCVPLAKYISLNCSIMLLSIIHQINNNDLSP